MKSRIVQIQLCKLKRRGFLNRVVHDDKKGNNYDIPKKKKSWGPSEYAATSTDKRNVHGKKLMSYIWWDQRSNVHYDCSNPTKPLFGLFVEYNF